MPRILAPTVYLLLAVLALPAAQGKELATILEPLLEAEFALQSGDRKAAAVAYSRAARDSADPALVARAVRVALMADEIAHARRNLARLKKLDPDSDVLQVSQLRLALAEGKAETAQAAFSILVEHDQGWAKAAAALVSAKDQKLAAAVLERAREHGTLPDQIEVWLGLGGVAIRLGDKALYARMGQSAVQRFPDRAEAWVWLAGVTWEAGDKAAARKALDTAAALPELDGGMRIAIAASLARAGDLAAAAAILASPDADDRMLDMRAGFLAQAEDEAGLQAMYEELKAGIGNELPSSQRLLLLGRLAESSSDDAAALGWYRQIRGGLERDQAQLRIAVLLERADDLDAALDVLHALQNGSSEWGEVVRDAYLLEAEFQRGRANTAAELIALDRGLAMFEGDPALRYSRALAYERVDQVEQALADLRLLVAEQPEEADFLNALGYTLVDRTERIAEGAALIEKALKLKPDSPAILDSMGWALHRQGRHGEALPYLQRAFEQQRDAEIAAHMVAVLNALGQKAEARSMLRLARELDPEHRALRHVEQNGS